ncbi:hypothetical protein AMTRI_Chr08g205050 [Amborella trichopoda]
MGGNTIWPGGSSDSTRLYINTLIVAGSVSANISGGHANPVVTFGAFVGVNITLMRAIACWDLQLPACFSSLPLMAW